MLAEPRAIHCGGKRFFQLMNPLAMPFNHIIKLARAPISFDAPKMA
jgi:hypothetical protein